MQVSATGATWEPYVHCNKASAVEKGEKVELNTPGLYRLYRVYCDSEIQLFPISLLKTNIDQPWLAVMSLSEQVKRFAFTCTTLLRLASLMK